MSIETGVSGERNPYTTTREASSLAKRLKLDARLRSLEETGIRTSKFREKLGLPITAQNSMPKPR